MMLSRVADNLFWLGRYLERAEHTVRLLKVGLDMQHDLQTTDVGWGWRRLAHSLQLPDSDVTNDYEQVRSIVLDADHHASVLYQIRMARDNARQVREQISTEMWEQLNRLFLNLSESDFEKEWDTNVFEFFQLMLRELHTFEGITNSTLSHGEGWQFLRIGRLIERINNTVTLLDFYAKDWQETPASPQQYLNWVMLLRDCTAFEAYCKVYSADLRFPQIVEFLLLNSEFPHAVQFAVLSVQTALDDIADKAGTTRSNPLYRRTGRLSARLRYADIDEIFDDGLHICLDDVRRATNTINALVHDTYIGYPIEEKLPSHS